MSAIDQAVPASRVRPPFRHRPTDMPPPPDRTPPPERMPRSDIAESAGPSQLEGPAARRHELADFLRSRRARLAPEDVGLPPGRRRRTPGLRREEVAELAGVGLTWYTWLEQGREIRASADVVEAVATALRLNADERDHLHALAGTPHSRHVDGGHEIPASVQAILDALDPCPAYVLNAHYDVLAWNRAEAALVGGFEQLVRRDRNMLWLVFTDPAWRELLIDYETDVSLMVARFRAAMGRHVGEPAWSSLVGRLSEASPAFREIWERHEVVGAVSKGKRFLHPRIGFLRLEHTTLRIAEVPECELRVYTPADEASRLAMERLASAPLPRDLVPR